MDGLTYRDKYARSFASVFSDKKRADYPDIPEPVIPPECDSDYADDGLNELQASIVMGAHCMALQKKNPTAMATRLDDIKTVGQAIAYLDSIKEVGASGPA